MKPERVVALVWTSSRLASGQEKTEAAGVDCPATV